MCNQHLHFFFFTLTFNTTAAFLLDVKRFSGSAILYNVKLCYQTIQSRAVKQFVQAVVAGW